MRDWTFDLRSEALIRFEYYETPKSQTYKTMDDTVYERKYRIIKGSMWSSLALGSDYFEKQKNRTDSINIKTKHTKQVQRKCLFKAYLILIIKTCYWNRILK